MSAPWAFFLIVGATEVQIAEMFRSSASIHRSMPTHRHQEDLRLSQLKPENDFF
jgi:hypothetical protein